MSFALLLERCRRLRLAAGLALPALVTACLTSSGADGRLHWARLGASYDQFMETRSDCIQRARYVNTGGGVLQAQPVPSLSLFKAGMEARGWYLNAAGYAAPPADEVRME